MRPFLYLGAGLGLLSGLSGGRDFERSNPAITGLIGVELPLGGATGLGFELALAAEFTGSGDRGDYTAAILRARLAQMLTPSARLWGAIGVGRAGYQDGSLAGTFAFGGTWMFVPKFGLDLSANLDLVARATAIRISAQPTTTRAASCCSLRSRQCSSCTGRAERRAHYLMITRSVASLNALEYAAAAKQLVKSPPALLLSRQALTTCALLALSL